MTYCSIPKQIIDLIASDVESGRYIMDDEAARRYFETMSRVLGIELKKDIRSEDIVPVRFDVPLSEEIRDHRSEKYD